MTVDDKRRNLEELLKILGKRRAGNSRLLPINFCPKRMGDVLSELDKIFTKTSQATGGLQHIHAGDLNLGVDTLLSLRGEIDKFGPGDLSFILPRIHTVLALL